MVLVKEKVWVMSDVVSDGSGIRTHIYTGCRHYSISQPHTYTRTCMHLLVCCVPLRIMCVLFMMCVCDVMRCDVCMWCDVMRCDVMSCHVMWCDVTDYVSQGKCLWTASCCVKPPRFAPSFRPMDSRTRSSRLTACNRYISGWLGHNSLTNKLTD
jgi:hypothetical protein